MSIPLLYRAVLSFLFGLSVLAVSTPPAEAVSEDTVAGKPISGEPVRVATVNVQNLQLLKQEDNVFTLEFNLSNREGVQPKIVYAVNLTRKTGVEDEAAAEAAIADKHVYNDLINLGENQSVRKQITYEAPDFLKGEYSLEVEARNPDGMPFGTSEVPGTIFLYGNGEGIQVDSESCSLTVEGENPQKRYSLDQGVDISSEETLVAHCTLANTFLSVRSVTPLFETRYRSAFGKIVATNKQESVSMSPGESQISFERPLPKVKDPQAYDAVLTFVDDRGKPLSPPVAFHYVLRGESATIQNVTLDRNSYKKGDIAAATFFWTGSADNFVGARGESSGGLEGVNLSLILTDTISGACSAELVSEVDLTDSRSGVKDFPLPITADCFEPRAAAKILDGNGRVLAENTYEFGSGALGSKSRESELGADKPISRVSIARAAVVGIVILPILIGLAYLAQKRRRNGLKIILALVLTGGFLGGSRDASADTFLVRTVLEQPSHYMDNTFSVNLDKPVYSVGEQMRVTGRYVSSACNNGWDVTAIESGLTHVKLDATINSITQTILEKNRDMNEYRCAAARIPVGCASPSCRPSVPARSLYCGPAQALYPSSATGFYGAFCQSGAVTNPREGISAASFPAPGGSVEWGCFKVPDVSGNKNFPADSSPGDYTANFFGLGEFYMWGVYRYSNSGTASIPYRVISGREDGKCGPAAQIYPSAAAAFSGVFCNSYYQPSPTPRFPLAGRSISWICRGYGPGSKSDNCTAEVQAATSQTLRACLSRCGTGEAPLSATNPLRIAEGEVANVAACLGPASQTVCSSSDVNVTPAPTIWSTDSPGVASLFYSVGPNSYEVRGLGFNGQPSRSTNTIIRSGPYQTTFLVNVDCIGLTACNNGWNPLTHCVNEENFCSNQCGGILTENGTQTCNEHSSWIETLL